LSALLATSENVLLMTRLSPEAVQERLTARLGPGFALREAHERPLTGTVGGGTFALRRWRTRRSLLWPVAKGRFDSTPDGTRIEMRIGQDNLERLLAAGLFLAIVIAFSLVPGMFIALPVALLGAAVAYVGINLRSTGDVRFLRDLIVDTLEARPAEQPAPA
jgi:hypothetical protein